MLTNIQIKHYREKGYVIPDYCIRGSILREIREKHSKVIHNHPEYRDNCPDLLSYDPTFIKYAQDSEILNMVTQLIGSNIALWNMSFFAKPAKRQNDSMASRWTILADKTLSNLHSMDSN